MADWNKVTKRWEGGGPKTQKGAEAGRDAKFDALERQGQEQKFLEEKGWSGMGGAKKRPPKPEYEREFSSWLMKRGKNEGQKKALAETE